MIFGDSTTTSVSSNGADEARFQIDIYAPTFNSTSARTKKSNIDPVDPGDVLSGVESLRVATWEFDDDPDDQRHLGPMAKAFNDTFDVGGKEGHISTVDADGIALAAIQGLAERQAGDVERLEADDERLRERLDRKDRRIADLERTVREQRERLAVLEERVGGLDADGPVDPAGD